MGKSHIRDSVGHTVEKRRRNVQPVASIRGDWATAAQAMAERGEDQLLDPETPTSFDDTEWEWHGRTPGSAP